MCDLYAKIMSERLRSCLTDLEFVSKLKPKTRKIVLKELAAIKKDYYLALKEIAKNTVKRNIDISKTKLSKRAKQNILSLAHNKSKKQRKRLLVQSGGWISWIVPLVISLLQNGTL